MSGVHEVFHVSMLRKYTPDPAHVVDWGQIEVATDGTFKEGPVCILDSRDQSARIQYGSPIPSCLGMKVRGLVV